MLCIYPQNTLCSADLVHSQVWWSFVFNKSFVVHLRAHHKHLVNFPLSYCWYQWVTKILIEQSGLGWKGIFFVQNLVFLVSQCLSYSLLESMGFSGKILAPRKSLGLLIVLVLLRYMDQRRPTQLSLQMSSIIMVKGKDSGPWGTHSVLCMSSSWGLIFPLFHLLNCCQSIKAQLWCCVPCPVFACRIRHSCLLMFTSLPIVPWQITYPLGTWLQLILEQHMNCMGPLRHRFLFDTHNTVL